MIPLFGILPYGIFSALFLYLGVKSAIINDRLGIIVYVTIGITLALITYYWYIRPAWITYQEKKMLKEQKESQ